MFKQRESRYRDGDIRGYPDLWNPWCQADLKRVSTPNGGSSERCSDGRDTTRAKKTKIVDYLGIAADEPKRFGQLNDWKRAPLVEFDIEEELCGLYCQYNDILSPSYETSFRDGCWFCHNQGVDQLRFLWKNYPDLWAILMKWDLDSPTTFKADGHTVHDYDLRFRMEQERLVPTGRSFRWSMLEKPPAFVAYEAEQMKIF